MRLLAEDQEILGTYRVERFLGEGGFAQVFRVRNMYLERREALKVFKAVTMSVEETKERLSEAVLLSRLEHPNIIRVHAAGTTDTHLGTTGFFTMEYVPGGTLDQFWRSHGLDFVPVETSVQIVSQACRAIAEAHGALRRYPGGTENDSILRTVLRSRLNNREASWVLIPLTRHACRTRAYKSTRYTPTPPSQYKSDRRL